MTKYNQLVHKIKERFPDVKIKYKDEHWQWKILSRKIRKSGTAFPKTIWLPTRNKEYFRMLAHEYQHLVDMNEIGKLRFFISYLSPQFFSLFWFFMTLVALGLGSNAFVVIHLIVACLFLLPWPSKERVQLEMRGYKMSMFVARLQNVDMLEYQKKVIDSLRSWLYYKMVWTCLESSKLVSDSLESIDNEEASANMGIAFQDIHEIFKD